MPSSSSRLYRSPLPKQHLWPLLRQKSHPKNGKTMRVLLTYAFAACFVSVFTAMPCSAQNDQKPPDTTAAQTPAAQRENYDPLLDLPPLPRNRVTLIGGTVSSLDEVMNRMWLRPFGQKKTMFVAFDTRTRFFQDGHPISYRDIRQGQRVYVDTMLNGSKVFAKKIWIQSAADSGIARGQIVDFDSQHSTLTVRDELSSQAVKMQITPTTVIRNGDRPASIGDLSEGSLVSLEFGPQRDLREITVSAKPGTSFTFAGRITYLDVSRKLIALDNRSDQVKYDISVDAIAPSIVQQLHEGDEISIEAIFDGSRYDARRIDLSAPTQGAQQ